VAAVALVAVDVLYLGIVQSQGESPFPLVARFIAGFFAVVAVALIGSLFTPPVVRVAVRGAAAGALAAMTVMSAMSIGAAVLVPAVLCGAATAVTVARAPATRNVVIAIACVVAGAVGFLAGLQAAWSFYPNT
jgi:hypothetical protein